MRDLCIGPLPRPWQSDRSKESDWTRLMALTGKPPRDIAELRAELVRREFAGQERVLVILLRELSLLSL